MRLSRPYYPGGASPPHRFGLLPGRSPLLGESLLFSLPAGTKMFQFPAFASPRQAVMPPLQGGGLSHSETCGSMAGCASPQIFAASHVLHRLLEPRHPPCALLHFCAPRPPNGRGSMPAAAMRRPPRLSFALLAVLCPRCQRSSRPKKGAVENIGFEPMASCMPCKRSSQLS